MHDHRKLEVWRAGRSLVPEIYEITRDFPDDERFGLTSQLRRAAVSIPSNIAEGAGRARGGRTFAQFLRVAAGSASELETQLQIAHDLGLGSSTRLIEAAETVMSIREMLWALERHHTPE